MKILHFFSILLFLQSFSLNCYAESGSLFKSNNGLFADKSDVQDEFLSAGEAFKVDSSIENNVLKLHWVIADGYYLYEHRFKFKTLAPEKAQLGKPVIRQTGKTKEDPIFGTVIAHYHEVDIDIPVISSSTNFIEIQAGYQGCADKGLCYTPQKKAMYFPLDINSGNLSEAPISSASSAPKQAAIKTEPPTDANLGATTGTLSTTSTPAKDTSSAIGLASILGSNSLIAIVGIFFVLGLGLTFTPCVLPMIPILSGIIVGQGKHISRKKAFMLSLAYVLGMASTYAIAGVIAGKTGSKIQLYLQDPTVLFSFAGVFVLLSLSMFGFYELQLPSSIQNKLNDISHKQKGGTLIGVAIMGALSALVVSP